METYIVPTDEEILAYKNVPLSVAASYIGKSTWGIRDGLRSGELKFGAAVQTMRGWAYSISPALLVAHKHST